MEAEFRTATRRLADKLPEPSKRRSAQWAKVATPIRERSFFSARVESIKFLERARTFLLDFLGKTTEEVETPAGGTTTALKAGSKADFVRQMRERMVEEGMAEPADFAEGEDKITNIGARSRLGLIFDTQILSSYGFGRWEQGMEPSVLRAFPASRFVRIAPVREKRPRHAKSEGMVVLKTDYEWWANYQNDPEIGGFGVPWEPYGFNSGMGQEDVSREEAEALGLISPGQEITPPDLTPYGATLKHRYNAGMSAQEPLDPELRQRLRDSLRAKFGPGAISADGRVTIDPLKEGRKEVEDNARKRAERVQRQLEANPRYKRQLREPKAKEERIPAPPQSLGDILDKWEGEGISAFASIKGNDITLSKIIVPSSNRGQGIGGEKMAELLKFAKEQGLRVLLTPSTDFGATSKTRLAKFYTRLGFTKNTGRKRDLSTMETMIWTPEA